MLLFFSKSIFKNLLESNKTVIAKPILVNSIILERIVANNNLKISFLGMKPIKSR